jgi:hypothetical protein
MYWKKEDITVTVATLLAFISCLLQQWFHGADKQGTHKSSSSLLTL